MNVRVCMYVRKRERERHKVYDREYASLMYFDKGERLNYFTRWEEGTLYSHPLSSLSTRHINMGKEEAHKLCVIEYDSMTHT